MTLFYDSTRPELIPAGAEYAALYSDGKYACPPKLTERFKYTRYITVSGNWKTSGIADFEKGNAVYENTTALRAWVAGRNGMSKRARIYTDRSDLALVRERCSGLEYLVWVATLDGNKLRPDWTEGLWAVQYAGGLTVEYDTSILYGEW